MVIELEMKLGNCEAEFARLLKEQLNVDIKKFSAMPEQVYIYPAGLPPVIAYVSIQCVGDNRYKIKGMRRAGAPEPDFVPFKASGTIEHIAHVAYQRIRQAGLENRNAITQQQHWGNGPIPAQAEGLLYF